MHCRDGVADRALLETWLILEFCDRGNLADAVQKGRLKLRGSDMPDLPAILRCLVDIAAGVQLPISFMVGRFSALSSFHLIALNLTDCPVRHQRTCANYKGSLGVVCCYMGQWTQHNCR